MLDLPKSSRMLGAVENGRSRNGKEPGVAAAVPIAARRTTMDADEQPEDRDEDSQKAQTPAEQQKRRKMVEAQEQAAEERKQEGGYQ